MTDEMDRNYIWTREQDRAFEDALVAYYMEDSDDCWEKIAKNVPGKTVEEIKCHYNLLVEDLDRIESGIVPLPCYSTCSDESAGHGGDDGTSKKGVNLGHRNSESIQGGKASKVDQERRKGVAWTEDEHRLFLLGLEKYGKGDWRSISRNFVVTRTPTQVASHAQKYFIRQNSMSRERRRTSIHDITSVNNGDTSAPQPAGKLSNQSPHATPISFFLHGQHVWSNHSRTTTSFSTRRTCKSFTVTHGIQYQSTWTSCPWCPDECGSLGIPNIEHIIQ